jgi:hypothetical protein
MTFDGIRRIFLQKLGDVRQGEAASRKGIEEKSPLSGFSQASKYSKPDGFTSNRQTGEALAGQVHAHHVNPGITAKIHSANSTRGQKALADLWERSDSRILGLSIQGGDSEAGKVSLGTSVNSRQGHNDLANLFKAADARFDQAA